MNEILNYSWRVFASFNEYTVKFNEYFEFYNDNNALYSELALAPTVYDAIIGNYYFKLV